MKFNYYSWNLQNFHYSLYSYKDEIIYRIILLLNDSLIFSFFNNFTIK